MDPTDTSYISNISKIKENEHFQQFEKYNFLT